MRVKVLIGLLIIAITFAVSYSMHVSHGIRQLTPSCQDCMNHGSTVTGRVLDTWERPVSGAEVQARTDSGSFGKVPTAYTDEQGVFTLGHLAPETYTLSVAKEEEGYPNTSILPYSDGLAANTRVTLSEHQTISDVTLHLGPKAARLTGHFINGSTGKPIKDLQGAEIVLRRADDPRHFLSTGPDLEGNFSILVPTVPFTLEVSAPGYEKWQHNSNSADKHTSPIRMAAGEEKELTVTLQPIN